MIYFDKPFECMASLPDGLTTAMCNIIDFKTKISLTELAYELMYVGFIVSKVILRKIITQFPFFQFQYEFKPTSSTISLKKK